MPRHSCAWLVLLVMIQLALCQLVRRLRRLLEKYYIFYVNVYFDPEVDSRRGIQDIISTSSIWQFLRQLQRLSE